MGTNQKRIFIIGDNAFALAMIFETLYCLHGNNCRIGIIVNRDVDFKDEEFNGGIFFWETVRDSDHIFSPENVYFIAGMSPASRNFLFSHYLSIWGDFILSSLIHPSAIIPYQHLFGGGIRIEPSVTVGPFVTTGNCCFFNRGSIIGHHTTFGDFVNVNPGAIVNGKCRIGSNTTIGAGAIVNDGINIGSNCIIGSGSLVTRDIPDNTIAYGSPAKVIKTN